MLHKLLPGNKSRKSQSPVKKATKPQTETQNETTTGASTE